METQNAIIPNMAKSINFSFRQPPVLQKPQEVDEFSYTCIPSKSGPFLYDLQW
jgi:hypothetical protein